MRPAETCQHVFGNRNAFMQSRTLGLTALLVARSAIFINNLVGHCRGDSVDIAGQNTPVGVLFRFATHSSFQNIESAGLFVTVCTGQWRER